MRWIWQTTFCGFDDLAKLASELNCERAKSNHYKGFDACAKPTILQREFSFSSISDTRMREQMFVPDFPLRLSLYKEPFGKPEFAGMESAILAARVVGQSDCGHRNIEHLGRA